MESTPPRMFATVGRPRRDGPKHSRGLLLLIAVGLTLSTFAFGWELASREHLTVVEVRLAPMDDAGAP